MPVLGRKSPTPALPNLVGRGTSGLTSSMMNDLSAVRKVSGMVVPQIQKLFTENSGHSGNISIPHPADAVDLAKMILPRGGSRRVVGQYYSVGQFRNNERVMPMENVGDMYMYP